MINKEVQKNIWQDVWSYLKRQGFVVLLLLGIVFLQWKQNNDTTSKIIEILGKDNSHLRDAFIEEGLLKRK